MSLITRAYRARLQFFKEMARFAYRQALAWDIDGTLAVGEAYWHQLLCERFGNPAGLTFEEALAKYRYLQLVPQWNNPEAHAFMHELATSAETHLNLPVMPGALEAVKKIHTQKYVTGCYLTARLETMEECSAAWGKNNGFPHAPVFARPADVAVTDSARWKAEVLEFLYPEIVGIVDNDRHLPRHFDPGYQGRLWIIHSTENPHPERSFARPAPTFDHLVSDMFT